MKNLIRRSIWGFLGILFLSLTTESLVAQPVVKNQVATIKTVSDESPESRANPSDPGIFAMDLNGDGIDDYIQSVLNFRNKRDEDSEDSYDTVILSYDEFGTTVKSAYIEGLYFALGDLDGDGIPELATQNDEGDIEIVRFAETEENPFASGEITVIESPPGERPNAGEALTGDLDADGIDDILFCENEFDSYNTCILVNGVMVSNNATTVASEVIDFRDYEIEFNLPPRLVVDKSIAGSGNSLYAIGTTDNFSKDILVEFGVDENGDFISLLEYEWVSTSGEGVYDRRYYFDDVDGDGEIEIISSDNREFPLAGFRRFYFNDPVCDFRDVDYSGDNPDIQNPTVISNNCVIDRVYLDEDDEPWLGFWQSGNYKACDTDQIPIGCSEQPFINNDQTLLPQSFDAAKSLNQPQDTFFNGVADPSRQARGLQPMKKDVVSGIIFQPLALISEILRVAEIYKTLIILKFIDEVINPLVRTSYFGGGVQEEQNCRVTEPCQFSSSAYLTSLQSGGIRSVNSDSRVSEFKLHTVTAKREVDEQGLSFQKVEVTVDNRSEYVPPSQDLEDYDELDKQRGKASDLVEYDTLSVTTEVNLSPMGTFDEGFSTFTVKNIGDIDGMPGEEIMLGSNSMASGGQAVNKTWIYLGENTTFNEPDYEIDFSLDSLIDGNSFRSLGRVVEGLGDINGDGIGDFAVGLPFYDQRFDGVSYGAVYIFTGIDRSAAKIATDTTTFETPFLVLRPEEAEYVIGSFGSEISGGDFDGDGYNDIAVLADNGSNSPVSPTIRIFKGGPEMDATPDYFLHVTEEHVGGFSSDTVNSFFEAVVHFMPEEVGADHQDLYFSPGAFSKFPDAVIFRGGVDEQAKANGINTPATIPAFTLAEAGETTTGSGVFNRSNPATGDLNGDGKYEVIVEKQYDGRDGAVSSRLLIFSPNSGIEVSNEDEVFENLREYRLSQNYPNPFNPATNIEFRLGNSSQVTLKVFDLLGREVATLIDGELYNKGSHQAKFDASALASGLYLYRLEAGGFIQTRKMMLIK